MTPSRRHSPTARRAAAPLTLVAALLALAPDPTSAAEPRTWALVEGRRTFEAVAWPASCGPRPEERPARSDGRYLRRGAALVPVDDALPLFGPGVCRALAPGSSESLEGTDIRCTAPGGSLASASLRQPGPNALSVVHQVRLVSGEGCVAESTGTWTLSRVVDGTVLPLPAALEPRPGSSAALAPVAPPVLPPPLREVPRSTATDLTVEVLTPPAPPVAGSRVPLLALSGLLIVTGLLGLVRALRRTG